MPEQSDTQFSRRAARIMNFVGLLFLSLTVLMLSAYAASDTRVRLVTIGSGSLGGVYYPAAGVLCRLLNLERERHGLRCVVEISDGSVANVESLAGELIDIGIVQTDVQYDAFHGFGQFSDQKEPVELRSLFSLHAEPVTIVSRLDAGISDFSDLVGKRVNVGEPGSGSFATSEILMRAFDINATDFAGQFDLPAAEAALALCENRLDAFIYVVGHPNRTIREASESCAVKFVSVTGHQVDTLLANNRFFSRATISPGVYVGQEERVLSLGVRASVLATEALPDRIAYEITKAVFSQNTALRRLHPAFRNLTPERMLTGNSAPWHEGSARYLHEIGLLKEAGVKNPKLKQ